VLGGKTLNSIFKNVNCVIPGKGSRSKIDKARDLKLYLLLE